MSDKADIEVKKESSQCGSSTSDSETRSNRRLLGKRKENPNAKDENDSVMAKQARSKISKIPVKQSSPVDTTDGSSREATSSTTNETLDQQARQGSRQTSKRERAPLEPSDFQVEVNALSFEEFVERTNIRELVTRDFEKQYDGTREITPTAMEYGLKEYDRLRKLHDKWHYNSLKNLKFKNCECKRKTTFTNLATQTEISVEDKEIQYSSMDCNGNEENVESKQHSSQSKMALLSVYKMSDAQTINIRYDLSESQCNDPDDAIITDDDDTVYEAEENIQSPSVAAHVEVPFECTVNGSPEASGLAVSDESQSTDLHSSDLHAQNRDQNDGNNADGIVVNEIEAITLSSDAQEQIDDEANTSPEASELATEDSSRSMDSQSPYLLRTQTVHMTDDVKVNEAEENAPSPHVASEEQTTAVKAPELPQPQSSQSAADNDKVIDKASIDNVNSPQLAVKANASGIENVVNVVRAENRSKFFKIKHSPNRSALRSVLMEIGQQLGSKQVSNEDFKRKVDLCLDLSRHK